MLKRVSFFVYGAACYAAFLGTFLYAIGFIGNFLVPTTLDGPATDSLGLALAINTGLLALFAVQHSVMARAWFKQRWTRLVPKPVERSTYTLFSSLALILLFWQWRPMGGTVWSVENPIAVFALLALFTFGWVLVLAATFQIDHFDLFGLRQVWLYLVGKPYTPRPFATPALYKQVRHPLYVGWFFTFWMTPTMTAANLLFAFATTAYILLAIQFEERDLVREFGRTYEDYRRRVPMLVPFTGSKKEATVRHRAAV
jgi:protein-S-isoprenylcysteine O-methyltransferase Ste14